MAEHTPEQKSDWPAAPSSGRRASLRLVGYVRPYRWGLVVAFVGLVVGSLLGFFNLLLLKPAVELLGGETQQRQVVARKIAGSEGPRRAGGIKPVERTWERLIAPIKSPLAEANESFRRYGLSNPRSALWLIALALLGLAGVKGLIECSCQYVLARACFGMVADLREELFRKIIAQDYLFFVRQSTGYLESRIQSDVAAIRRGGETLLRSGFQAPFQFLFLAILLLGLNFRLTLIALVVVLVAVGPLLYLARVVRRVTREAKRQADRLAAGLEESLRNFAVVKFFQSEPLEIEKFADRNRQLLRYFLKNRLAQFSSAPLTQFAAAAGRSAVLIVGGYLVFAGQMEFSTLVVYLVALTRFYGPARSLSRAATLWPVLNVSAERMVEILNLQPAVGEARDALPLERVREAVEFQNVSFAYSDQEALNDVSFRVPVGRVVALVGPSGAGKTTLVCLLARLFDPTRGSIEIDGTDLRRYRLADLRRAIATVTQDTILFNDTVGRNIAYPDAEADMDRVAEAARAANAHDFIVALDGDAGYDTVIGQAGQRLSGGQRQRIAIARALYRDPQILVFDEATSSLDEESQALVQEAIQNLFRGRTVFIIAHRLSTVRRADEILVLHKGQLVECGSHDELLRCDGFYASLHRISRGSELLDLETAS